MPSHFKVVQRNVVFQYQSIFVMEMHLLRRVKGSKASDDPQLLEDIHFAVPERHLKKKFFNQNVLLYPQQFCSAKRPYVFIKDFIQNVNHPFRQPSSRPRSIMKIRNSILNQTGEDKLVCLQQPELLERCVLLSVPSGIWFVLMASCPVYYIVPVQMRNIKL